MRKKKQPVSISASSDHARTCVGRLKLCAAFCIALCSTQALAFDRCVHNSMELQTALSEAESNGEADTIKLTGGSYTPVAFSNAFTFLSNEPFALTINGGYSKNCAVQSPGADSTQIDGHGMSGLLNLTIESGSAPLSLGNMTLKHGVELNSVAPLTIGDQAIKGWNGQLRVENIKVKYNKAQDCVANFGKADLLVVRNSLFVDNQADTSVVAVKGRTIVFTGNSVASNDVPSALFSQAVYMSGDEREFIANNIIANNIALDLGIYANQGVADLQNNDIGAFFAPPWVVVKQNLNITVQPTFMAKQDYRLVPGSQQIDAGAQGLDPGMFDVDGAPRVQGIVDIGAYERKNATP